MDVARHAGVSQSTVSLVLSGRGAGRVSSATADAVRAAAADLGYRPNVAARALKSGTAAAVGLVVSDVTHPFFGRTLRGAQQAAWEHGHAVVLINDQYGAAWTGGSIEVLRAGAIDGFLFFAADPPETLRTPGSPPIVIMEATAPRFASVRFDVEAGVDAALALLHQLGHREIGLLRSKIAGETFDRRHARWREHLRANGVDAAEMADVASGFRAEQTIQAGLQLLDHPRRPTAVICDDDVLASGLLAAARERGVRVPDDLSVVGFDDLDHARIAAPPLTTVALDAEQLGAVAFELLHARLQGKRPRSRVLGCELVVRESTGPARLP